MESARVAAWPALAALVLAPAAAAPGQGGGTGPQPSEPETAIVWAVGDGADGSDSARRVARLIARDNPDRFLYLGDVYDQGTAAEFRRNFAGVYRDLVSIAEPTPGNHEWGRRREGYFPYWRRVKGARRPPWYRFELAGWELISLNSEAAHGPGSRQLRWLRRVVAERPGTCRLAFMHRPRFSAGLHGDAPDIAPLWGALRGRARLVLSGHDHDMQRFRRRGGLVQLVSGAGGGVLYALRADGRLAFGRSDRRGALRLELDSGGARVEFRGAAGRTLDRSRVRCEPLGAEAASTSPRP